MHCHCFVSPIFYVDFICFYRIFDYCAWKSKMSHFACKIVQKVALLVGVWLFFSLCFLILKFENYALYSQISQSIVCNWHFWKFIHKIRWQIWLNFKPTSTLYVWIANVRTDQKKYNRTWVHQNNILFTLSKQTNGCSQVLNIPKTQTQ